MADTFADVQTIWAVSRTVIVVEVCLLVHFRLHGIARGGLTEAPVVAPERDVAIEGHRGVEVKVTVGRRAGMPIDVVGEARVDGAL